MSAYTRTRNVEERIRNIANRLRALEATFDAFGASDGADPDVCTAVAVTVEDIREDLDALIDALPFDVMSWTPGTPYGAPKPPQSEGGGE